MCLKEYLKENILLFDGAMGTYFSARNGRQSAPCETANITFPDAVLAIHKEYILAGAEAVKTNTFGANRKNFSEKECEQIIDAGWKIAQEAGAQFVFADIGPVRVTDDDDPLEEYLFVVDCFLDRGAENFLFETNSDISVLTEVAEYIKKQAPESFIAVSFAAMPDGFTRSGLMVYDLIKELEENADIDCVGLNCVSSARHMVKTAEMLPDTKKFRSMMPNAGYPVVLGGRTVYDGAPEYFAQQMKILAQRGVKLLGGCCGTTPEHIAKVKSALKDVAEKTAGQGVKSDIREIKTVSNPFYEALCDPERKPFAVELDPPESADVSKFIAGARELKESGADIITIADCPIARARMDSSLLACKLSREMNIEAIPHMTCRDRNLNATKALLLGLCAEGVHNVLTVTGDPIPSESRDEVKSVYNFNSRMLSAFIRSLGETTLPVPFRVFGALNINARNFHIQLSIAKEKEKNGICGFFTQPVLTRQGLENLKLARETLNGKILGGIIPIISHRNACFMNSEVAGINVDEKIIALYEGADRQKGEELAVKISVEIAKEMAPYIDGYYLITPFSRTGLIARIIKEIKTTG